MDFDKLIDKHFGTMMSHKTASVQHYIETGQVSGTFRNSLRHMLSDAMSEGRNVDAGESNCTIDIVSKPKGTVCLNKDNCKQYDQRYCKIGGISLPTCFK